ncbi:hypothetical protein GGR58DRAFT_508990 [Xylaria digitata]|nr:hypothetical protein GGR58DRAFT_508990 [Xylaria digitata]
MSGYSNPDEADSFIPDLSGMVLDGVALRNHVFSDLKPYVCTFEHCLSQSFESWHEWFQHELDNHRRQMVCIFCNSPTAAYSSETDMVNHLRDAHVEDVTDAQLYWLLQACDRAVLHSGTFDCPFCDEWNPGAEDIKTAKFDQHVAGHLRALSLVSLPLAVDGLEVKNDRSECEQPADTVTTDAEYIPSG